MHVRFHMNFDCDCKRELLLLVKTHTKYLSRSHVVWELRFVGVVVCGSFSEWELQFGALAVCRSCAAALRCAGVAVCGSCGVGSCCVES